MLRIRASRFDHCEIYRDPAPRRVPGREPDPEVLGVVRRARHELVREYLERRRRAS